MWWKLLWTALLPLRRCLLGRTLKLESQRHAGQKSQLIHKLKLGKMNNTFFFTILHDFQHYKNGFGYQTSLIFTWLIMASLMHLLRLVTLQEGSLKKKKHPVKKQNKALALWPFCGCGYQYKCTFHKSFWSLPTIKNHCLTLASSQVSISLSVLGFYFSCWVWGLGGLRASFIFSFNWFTSKALCVTVEWRVFL